MEVLALVNEIGSALEGTYVNNIYSLGDAQVFRLRKPGGGDVWLIASPTLGMWVSDRVSERAETTEFTTELRGRLLRSKFVSCTQPDLDRVFELALGEAGSALTLVLELMPPGRLLLLDRDKRVAVASREDRSKRRRLVRGELYTEPPRTRLSPRDVTPDDVARMAAGEATVGRALGRHVAFPRKYVVEALARLSLREDEPSSRLSGREAEAAAALQGLVREAAERPSPCLCDVPPGEDVLVVSPRAFQAKAAAASVSSLCDQVLLPKLGESGEKEPDEVSRRILELMATVSKLREERDLLLREASLSRSKAAEAGRAASAEEALKSLGPKEPARRTEPSSPAAVASLLYDRAKEMEAKAAESGRAAERLEKKAAASRPRGQPAARALSRRQREWYEKFRWFFTSAGKLAIGGRDAQTNSILVRRHLQDSDTAFHADLFGSPFFILKGGAGQSEEEAREVAQATAAFSSAWKTGLGAADAYWVGAGQVGTAAPSGEYLARGSFAIRGKKNFVTRNIVELAVGLDASGRVVAGPETAVRAYCASYVTVRPYKEKASETAKRVLKDIEALSEGALQGRATLDDVARALPAGGGKVARRVRSEGAPRDTPRQA